MVDQDKAALLFAEHFEALSADLETKQLWLATHTPEGLVDIERAGDQIIGDDNGKPVTISMYLQAQEEIAQKLELIQGLRVFATHCEAKLHGLFFAHRDKLAARRLQVRDQLSPEGSHTDRKLESAGY